MKESVPSAIDWKAENTESAEETEWLFTYFHKFEDARKDFIKTSGGRERRLCAEKTTPISVLHQNDLLICEAYGANTEGIKSFIYEVTGVEYQMLGISSTTILPNTVGKIHSSMISAEDKDKDYYLIGSAEGGEHNRLRMMGAISPGMRLEFTDHKSRSTSAPIADYGILRRNTDEETETFLDLRLPHSSEQLRLRATAYKQYLYGLQRKTGMSQGPALSLLNRGETVSTQYGNHYVSFEQKDFITNAIVVSPEDRAVYACSHKGGGQEGLIQIASIDISMMDKRYRDIIASQCEQSLLSIENIYNEHGPLSKLPIVTHTISPEASLNALAYRPSPEEAASIGIPAIDGIQSIPEIQFCSNENDEAPTVNIRATDVRLRDYFIACPEAIDAIKKNISIKWRKDGNHEIMLNGKQIFVQSVEDIFDHIHETPAF